ncbi:MAG: hypothetical protein E6K76_10395 [Candidatus Eisenbacteria bacterium]|uniref:Uncharacterized protein n=1 Tax=Eiseniibacteriota bacterium TaxID=2212470 RepID=A0A538T1B3_UNCEI|nr:MAG: hypothetical protein E6K76_10395 [Candidatus Eisenbacteria bacterium]
MKRAVIAVSLSALLGIPLGAGAHEMSKHKSAVITGEVVDTGCYLGHAARGASHVSCATKCINAGMPIGLLTSQGTTYLLVMNHDNPDPYNSLKGMAGKTVSVRGALLERGGMKGIDVSEVKAASDMSVNTKK